MTTTPPNSVAGPAATGRDARQHRRAPTTEPTLSLETATRPDDVPPPPLRSPRRGTWALLRPLVLRLHFYAGVLVGPFLLVAALSGGLYALSPQVEEAVHADLLEGSSSAGQLPLAEQVAIAERVSTVDGLVAVRPAPEEGTTRVLFDDGSMAESYRHAVFVDPGTGEVLGQERVYGTSGALPLRSWIDELHRSLHLGDAGRLYSELAASWLWVVALGGLALWVPRARTRSWHGVLGGWLVLGFLALSATGLTWSQLAGENVTDLRAQLGWATPALTTTTGPDGAVDEADHAEHGGHGGATGSTEEADPAAAADPADVDAVLAAARAADITSDQVEVGLPAGPGSTWTVTEVHRAFPTQVDAAAVDPATLQVTDTVRFADHPFMAKLARWGVDIHMGTLFGLPNQIVLAGLALGLAAMVVLGYRMWWQRRPTRATGRRPGPAVPPGGLRALPWPGLVGVVVVTVAVGWFLPLLGLSLLAFLAVDVLVGLRRRQLPGTGAAR